MQNNNKRNALDMAFAIFNTESDPVFIHTQKNQKSLEIPKAKYEIIDGEEVKNGQTLKAITKRI